MPGAFKCYYPPPAPERQAETRNIQLPTVCLPFPQYTMMRIQAYGFPMGCAYNFTTQRIPIFRCIEGYQAAHTIELDNPSCCSVDLLGYL